MPPLCTWQGPIRLRPLKSMEMCHSISQKGYSVHHALFIYLLIYSRYRHILSVCVKFCLLSKVPDPSWNSKKSAPIRSIFSYVNSKTQSAVQVKYGKWAIKNSDDHLTVKRFYRTRNRPFHCTEITKSNYTLKFQYFHSLLLYLPRRSV